MPDSDESHAGRDRGLEAEAPRDGPAVGIHDVASGRNSAPRMVGLVFDAVPERGHGIPVELVEAPAVAVDHGLRQAELLIQRLDDALGVSPGVATGRRELPEIGDQHGDGPLLARRNRPRGRSISDTACANPSWNRNEPTNASASATSTFCGGATSPTTSSPWSPLLMAKRSKPGTVDVTRCAQP